MVKSMQNLGKETAAKAALKYIEPGMLVGLGSGSTSALFIEYLGAKCRQGLKIKAVATSEHSYKLAKSVKIPLLDIQKVTHLDIDVDGADEVDKEKRLIKGGGGALLREKIIACMSDTMIVIVDASKKVPYLGKFPLPVEILPFAYKATLEHIHALGLKGKIRLSSKKEYYLTDNHNYIYDIQLPYPCKKPEIIEAQLKDIPGVVETGFFIGIASKVIVGHPTGKVTTF